ncbi:MAG: ABC transporter permease subunit [Chloroflexota bacterium]|jgi:putative spermidine/putrescine transport system permease protein|nr:ABC transporter permease subunit [Chloroflexota bacterium]MDH5243726.1 ABC transporter permease subunit [Chloroflexota bacterium]
MSTGTTDRLGMALNVATVAASEPERRRRRPLSTAGAWLIFIIGFLYFFVPLFATFEFSLRAAKRDPVTDELIKPSLAAYENTFADPAFWSSLAYSFTVGLITIAVSLLLIVPTAYWVRLRVPRLRPAVEFVTLMPFVIPPVILVFGIIRIYSGPPLALTNTPNGSDILLVGAYVVLSFPYMYRAVDTGLAAMDVRSLTEAAQSMGAGWPRIIWQVIFPNLRAAILSGAFLTLAIVIGEYTIATFLVGTKPFGPYLSLLGQNKAYEPAAVSLISFGITWAAMGMLALLGRGTRGRVQVAGAR